MKIADMNWMQVEERVAKDDRCILPIGSVEQHAYLSLATDMILAEKVAVDAAEPLGVPVFPALPYGLASSFMDFPGTLTFSLATYALVIRDLLDSMYRNGFRRILMVNGHGGNTPAGTVISEWLNDHPDASVKLHDWWRAPKTWAKVMEIDPAASHASWMENFPWTRIAGAPVPQEPKAQIDFGGLARVDARRKRKMLGEGNYYGLFQRPDADSLALWDVAVAETREQLDNDWH
ncbi:creatininase family protein [Phyllobacterium sp. P30BS-XVII]|uniref:creatininase family protein n=1 Tax=Phyllobacterium sp. P30BS-XVII TaxID=2587046 RepID=UPI0015FDFB13|nr:creatininase family protein [Phyllobacterium sp. P30BS-XVII]MBA8902262.1 creatinine amidohydrolase [Phyllobacterium sp. P30BS-XVII]